MDEQPKNNSNGQNQGRILKNAGYLTIAFVLQKILSFLYFVYIARIIGPVDLGFYDPAKSLIPIFLILIDFSLSIVLVREIARQPHKVEEYLNSVLGMKIIFALIILLGMGLFTNLSNYSALTKTVLYLDGMIVALDTFTLTFFAVFRGMQNMKFEAFGMIITQIVTVVVGVAGLHFNLDLRFLFFAVLLGSIFNFLYAFILLKKKLKLRVRLSWNKEIIIGFLKMALPFAVYAILVKVYTYTDRYMLLGFIGKGSAGWYVVAHKFTYALEFIPSAFAASIFPAMSAYYISSKEQLTKTFERSMYYLLVLAVPISCAILVLADKIVISLSGPAYATSVAPLRILMIGLIVIFLNFPVGAFLNACNRQKNNMINMAITVGLNVILNYLLIKQYTIIGAAIAALISGIVLFSLGLRLVGKIIDYDKKFLLKTLLKTLTASLIMSGVIFAIKKYFDISFNLGETALLESVASLIALTIYAVIGILTYGICLVLFRGFDPRSFMMLFRKFVNKS